METNLESHIKKQIDITEEEVNRIVSYFEEQTFKKKENLLVEGKICRKIYFVKKGLLRLYFIDNNGNEQTIQFALEGWWMTDLMAFNNGKFAEFSIQAVEKTEVLSIDKNILEQLLLEFPKMERYFNQIFQRAYAASLLRVKYIFSMSKEDFYRFFSSKYPEFLQRVPQYLLASFLGLTPEYLSELRNRRD